MDIQFVFKNHTQAASLGTSTISVIEKQPFQRAFWEDLRRVNICFQKDETLDPILMSQLCHEWHEARRKLRLERRKHLKKSLQSTTQSDLKNAQAIRSAYLQLSKGLRLLKKHHTSQRKVPKLRAEVHAPIGEDLHHLIESSSNHREQLWIQRGHFYRSFYQFLMLQPWLKERWPLEVGIDLRGQVIDLHGFDIEKSPHRSCKGPEAETDLFKVKLSPHTMTDKQWKGFHKMQVRGAFDSLKCDREGCGHETSYINEKGVLTCQTHADKSKAWQVPWLTVFQKNLQALVS